MELDVVNRHHASGLADALIPCASPSTAGGALKSRTSRRLVSRARRAVDDASSCGEDASQIVVRITLHIMMMPARTTRRLVVERTPQAVEVALNTSASAVTLIVDNDVFV
jgi:hypothetical protein